MFRNPLVKRYSYSALRPNELWVYATMYATIVSLLMAINYIGYRYHTFYTFAEQFHRSLYYQFLGFEILILFIWSGYNSGSAIAQEISNKSFDFFRMLPLAAYEKAAGILIGKNLLVFLFAGANLVFIILFGAAAKIDVNVQVQFLAALVSLTVLANLVILLSSIFRRKKGNSGGLIIIMAIVFGMPMLAAMEELEIDRLPHLLVSFFSMKVPVLVLISLLALYFSGWALKGILRKFTYEQEPLFTKKGAILFLAGYIAIVTGFYYFYIPQQPLETVYSYWFITLAAALVIPFFALNKLDNYIEYSRDVGKSQQGKVGRWAVLRYSNLLLELALYAIWGACSIGMVYFSDNADMDLAWSLWIMLVLLTSYLFLMLLLEIYAVYTLMINGIGVLLGFVAGLYLGLPLLLGYILKNSSLASFSPLGFLASDEAVMGVRLLILNAVLCTPALIVIVKRYRVILAKRKRM